MSKLYVQDACINKRDNELGLGSIQLPLCDEAHDNGAQICQSVFKIGALHISLSCCLLTIISFLHKLLTGNDWDSDLCWQS